MAPNEVAKELSIDLRTEAGGTVFVKDKEGRSVESDWSVLDGKTVGETGSKQFSSACMRGWGESLHGIA